MCVQHVSAVPIEARRVGSPGAVVIGGCEPLDVGAANELRSSGKTASVLNH